jgi:hypothetical protein
MKLRNTGQAIEYYLERARLARERATLLSDENAKSHEIKLAESYERVAREIRNWNTNRKYTFPWSDGVSGPLWSFVHGYCAEIG